MHSTTPNSGETRQTPISAVLAAYEEAAAVGDVVRHCLRVLPAGSEVIVVDDGSRDRTSSVAREAGARVFRLSANRGKGYALRCGLARSRGPVIATLDADGQDDPSDLPSLLSALPRHGGLVIGSRFLGTMDPGAITILHRWGNLGLTSLINTLYRTNLTDTQAGMRVFDRKTLARCRLQAQGYDFETDLLLAVLESGRPAIEVGVRRMPRASGQSHLLTARDGLRIFQRIVARRLGSLGLTPRRGRTWRSHRDDARHAR